jgi:hypothetical protein
MLNWMEWQSESLRGYPFQYYLLILSHLIRAMHDHGPARRHAGLPKRLSDAAGGEESRVLECGLVGLLALPPLALAGRGLLAGHAPPAGEVQLEGAGVRVRGRRSGPQGRPAGQGGRVQLGLLGGGQGRQGVDGLLQQQHRGVPVAGDHQVFSFIHNKVRTPAPRARPWP